MGTVIVAVAYYAFLIALAKYANHEQQRYHEVHDVFRA
jgi:hypothetical protein